MTFQESEAVSGLSHHAGYRRMLLALKEEMARLELSMENALEPHVELEMLHRWRQGRKWLRLLEETPIKEGDKVKAELDKDPLTSLRGKMHGGAPAS